MNWQSRLAPALFIGVLASVLSSHAAYADGYVWRISKMSGMVRFSDAAESEGWRAAAPGESLRSPFRIETGQDGRVVLSNDGDVVTVKANSRVEITGGAASPLTKVLQSIGNLLYQVVPGTQRKFEVHTPYLVSVVKGTTFAVQVTEEFATVSLIEGLVDVLATDDGNRFHQEEIHPGEVAIFGRGKTRIEVVEPSTRVFEPSTLNEENLRRLDEALKELEPLAIEVIKLPSNAGRADTGTVDAGADTMVEAVEAEAAASVPRPSQGEERANNTRDLFGDETRDPREPKGVVDRVVNESPTTVVSPGDPGGDADAVTADQPGATGTDLPSVDEVIADQSETSGNNTSVDNQVIADNPRTSGNNLPADDDQDNDEDNDEDNDQDNDDQGGDDG